MINLRVRLNPPGTTGWRLICPRRVSIDVMSIVKKKRNVYLQIPRVLARDHYDDDDDDDFSLLFALKGHVEPTGTPVGFRVPSS